MLQQLAEKRREIAVLCRLYGVSSLEVFGSAARGEDFDPRHSDVDFLVEFSPDRDMRA
jgi:predicted nucleotidyltransferase